MYFKHTEVCITPTSNKKLLMKIILLHAKNQGNLSNIFLDITLHGILQSDCLSGYALPG